MVITPAEYERLKPLLWHVVPDAITQEMASLHTHYLTLALMVLREQPASRSQSLAMTALEESLLQAIQGLALQGIAQLPLGFEVGNRPIPGALP